MRPLLFALLLSSVAANAQNDCTWQRSPQRKWRQWSACQLMTTPGFVMDAEGNPLRDTTHVRLMRARVIPLRCVNDAGRWIHRDMEAIAIDYDLNCQ